MLILRHDPDLSACLWTTYRQCQLHLLDLQYRINQCLAQETISNGRRAKLTKLQRDSLALVEETCASIPYMIMREAVLDVRPSGVSWTFTRPPALLGGLHLQWVLYTILVLDIISPDIQAQIKGILLWIGRNLGIGQATILGSVSTSRFFSRGDIHVANSVLRIR
jgi:hypothetical protein